MRSLTHKHKREKIFWVFSNELLLNFCTFILLQICDSYQTVHIRCTPSQMVDYFRNISMSLWRLRSQQTRHAVTRSKSFAAWPTFFRLGMKLLSAFFNWQLIKKHLQSTGELWSVRCQRSHQAASDNERRRWNPFMVAESVVSGRKGIRIRHHWYWFETGEPAAFNIIVQHNSRTKQALCTIIHRQ